MDKEGNGMDVLVCVKHIPETAEAEIVIDESGKRIKMEDLMFDLILTALKLAMMAIPRLALYWRSYLEIPHATYGEENEVKEGFVRVNREPGVA